MYGFHLALILVATLMIMKGGHYYTERLEWNGSITLKYGTELYTCKLIFLIILGSCTSNAILLKLL